MSDPIINLITAPDKLLNDNPSILLVNPSDHLKDNFNEHATKIQNPINLYLFENNEAEIGWLFDVLRAYFNRQSWSLTAYLSVISLHNLVASALFVVLHISLRDLQSGLLVLLPSIVLGLLRDRGVSLMKLIGIHGLWNLGWFSIYSPT